MTNHAPKLTPEELLQQSAALSAGIDTSKALIEGKVAEAERIENELIRTIEEKLKEERSLRKLKGEQSRLNRAIRRAAQSVLVQEGIGTYRAFLKGIADTFQAVGKVKEELAEGLSAIWRTKTEETEALECEAIGAEHAREEGLNRDVEGLNTLTEEAVAQERAKLAAQPTENPILAAYHTRQRQALSAEMGGVLEEAADEAEGKAWDRFLDVADALDQEVAAVESKAKEDANALRKKAASEQADLLTTAAKEILRIPAVTVKTPITTLREVVGASLKPISEVKTLLREKAVRPQAGQQPQSDGDKPGVN